MALSSRKCKKCSSIIEHPLGANHKFCSEKCKRGTSICEECKSVFVPGKHVKAKYCSIECYYDHKSPLGSILSDCSVGYLYVKVPRGTPGTKNRAPGKPSQWMLQHRYVMQCHLGRPLTKFENVHHINGIRTDNRIENLELWNQSQPSGVKAEQYHCHGCNCKAD